MTDSEAGVLRALSERWRHTAAAWDGQLIERDDAVPPARGRQDIRNWINWLRSMADELDAALAAMPQQEELSRVDKGTLCEGQDLPR